MEVHVIQPTLNDAIFGAKTRPHLLHQTVVMQLANRRSGSAATKTKGLVRGGGKKPWRQKVRAVLVPVVPGHRSGLVAAPRSVRHRAITLIACPVRRGAKRFCRH